MAGRDTSRSHVVVIAVVSALAAVAAAVFADSSQAGRVASDGQVFATAQRLSSSAVGVKGNLGITVVLVSAGQVGVDVEADVDRAIERVRSDLDLLRSRAEDVDREVGGTTHIDLAARARSATNQVLEDLVTADTTTEATAADERARVDVVPLLDDLQSLASSTARAAQGRIDAEGSRAGDAARMSSLVVALIVPATAAWGLWSIGRRREERLALQAELDKRNALILARDELIAGLSHQLRTPLTAITGYAQALLDGQADEQLLDEGLRTIDSQAAELTRMVDDLVAMGRLEDGTIEMHAERVDPVKEIESLLDAANAWRGHVDAALSPTIVWADRLRLRHILTNLVSNAFRHGGPSVVIRAARVRDVYRVVVADNGDGLPAGKVDAVFEAYVNSPRDALVKGTLGVGLAVAKGLADQMGCRLGYERVNGYTMFVLDVPVAVNPGHAVDSPPGQRDALDRIRP